MQCRVKQLPLPFWRETHEMSAGSWYTVHLILTGSGLLYCGEADQAAFFVNFPLASLSLVTF